MKFLDTCVMLDLQHHIFDTPFIISSISLKELEHIKTSYSKDPDIKYKARKLLHLLFENREQYEIIPFTYEDELESWTIFEKNDDARIILTAYHLAKDNIYDEPIEFITKDLCCYSIAKLLEQFETTNFLVSYSYNNEDSYTGFKEIQLVNDELATFYNINMHNLNNPYKMKINEYLIIKDANNNIVDQYKYTDDGFKAVPFYTFESEEFGTTKPKDIYQRLAMDSLKRNKITMLRGAAGTGKSYLAMSCLFEKLRRHEIDKIIIFCNTVATAGAAKLGFYPGSRDEKLLDSQIGNFLASKFNDPTGYYVNQLMSQGVLTLLPMSDIRGYDTSGMRAGIYITEAQNLDIELMRLALQRIGEDSFCILDGYSEAQVDLPQYAGSNNGMRRVSEVFRNDSCYGEITLQTIHRSHIASLAQKL